MVIVIEPMDCAPVTKLADGPGWLYEILCGPPHKKSNSTAIALSRSNLIAA